MAETTSTAAFDDHDAPRAAADAGLVLVYATGWAAMRRGFLLTGNTHIIGREPGAGGFAIEQSAVSRTHAVIHRDGDGARVKDLGSRNGTFVNGERVTAAALRDGDDLRVGDAIFRYVSRDASAHLAYGLDGTVDRDAAPATIAGAIGGLSMARLSADVDASVRAHSSVLVLGETGVGKELVAHAVHTASSRSGAFVAVNCAALAPALVESELFGHKRGAFTGADRDHEGLVRSAHGGTLLLDEIGDLPLESQAKLLRVLESHEVLAVGDTRARIVDVHVVCATHRDLGALAARGAFRADLFARISGFVVRVPPLRARMEDVFMLARHFLGLAGASESSVTFPFVAQLCRYTWPLNVRELRNAMMRAAALADGGPLRTAHLPTMPIATQPEDAEPRARRRAPSAKVLATLLHQHEGNVSAVARELERDAAQVYRWLKRFDLDPASFRPKE